MRYSILVSKTQDYRLEVSAPAGTTNFELADLAIGKLSGMQKTQQLGSTVGPVRFQIQEAVELLPNWSGSQASAAALQGWRIGEHISGLAVLQVSSYPAEHHNEGSFKNDNAATHWVRYKAEQGDELCAAAILYIEHLNSGKGGI